MYPCQINYINNHLIKFSLILAAANDKRISESDLLLSIQTDLVVLGLNSHRAIFTTSPTVWFEAASTLVLEESCSTLSTDHSILSRLNHSVTKWREEVKLYLTHPVTLAIRFSLSLSGRSYRSSSTKTTRFLLCLFISKLCALNYDSTELCIG